MEILRLASLTHLHPLSMRQLAAMAPHASEQRTQPRPAPTSTSLVMFSTRDIRLLRESAPDTVAALLAACALAPQRGTDAPQLALVRSAAA